MQEPDLEHEARRLATTIALVFAALMNLIVGLFVLFTGLLAPAWAAAMLIMIWVGSWWLLWRWRHRSPWHVLAVPVGMAAVWYGVLLAGDAWLGWTA